MRVLLYVQHLQGIGHVVRSSRIARALANNGFSVTVMMGGMPVAGLGINASAQGTQDQDITGSGSLSYIQLPPLKASASSFRDLLDAKDVLADDAYKQKRRDRLLEVFVRTRPQVLMIEAFPFDRPQMHFELLPLLKFAKAFVDPPLIVSSIRDILQIKPKPERDAKARDLLLDYFDHVLVHGDPRLARLDDTFRHGDEIAHLVSYTGIVAPDAPIGMPGPTGMPEEKFDVIVSTGGGATAGHRVLNAAMEAKPLTSLRNARWLALVGPFVESEYMDSLEATAIEHGVTLRPFTDNLPVLLAHARMSVSQAGYNTVADLLRTGCPSVLCPYAGIRQNEQTYRAMRLSRQGVAQWVADDALSARAVALAFEEALVRPRPSVLFDLEGAKHSAAILRQLLTDERSV